MCTYLILVHQSNIKILEGILISVISATLNILYISFQVFYKDTYKFFGFVGHFFKIKLYKNKNKSCKE